MPVSGKAKRPAVRPSVDYATYGHESGWRQGLQLHITNAPSGSFLVFLLARLAVSAMADEARLAPVNGHRRRCSSLPKVPDADSANEVVSGRNRLPGAISHRKARSWRLCLRSCGRVSCTQTCGVQGPSGRAQSRPPSCGSRRDSAVQFCTLPEI